MYCSEVASETRHYDDIFNLRTVKAGKDGAGCTILGRSPSQICRGVASRPESSTAVQRMSILLRDFQYGFRQLRKAPAFALTATLTLALGVGASTAIFSVVYGLLLGSLPFRDAGRIVNILETHPQLPAGAEATYPDYQSWRTQQKSFEQIAAYSTLNPNTVSLTVKGHSEQVHRVLASGSFFPLLGISPLIGRMLGEQDDMPGADHVAVISAEAWQRYFGRDPGVVGRSVALNGVSYSVIGVMPFNAAYPGDGEVWLPLSLLDQATQASRVWHSVRVLGRLRAGVEISEARADMQTVSARIGATYPATNRNVGVRITSLREELVGAVRPAVLAVAGSVALLLLIACTNVASLLKVRAIANRREIGIRQALGAGRVRLVAQSLAHAMILCLFGGTLGIGLALLGLPLMRLGLSHTDGIDPSTIQSIRLDFPVLVFTLSTCLLTAVVFGLLPVMGPSSKLGEFLRPADRGSTNSQGRARGVLIAGEIAVTVAIVFLSTLVVRSFQRLVAIDPGFRTEHLLSLEITLPEPRYQNGSPVTNHFFDQLLDRVAQSPGVISAGSTTQLPLNPSQAMTRFLVEGAPPIAPGSYPMAQIRSVSPDLFRTMGIAVKTGRVFDRNAIDSNISAFVVNEAFVKQYLAGRNPLGANILIGVLSAHPVKIPIIGVVSNTHDLGVETEPQPELYLPGFGLTEVLLIRTASDPLEEVSVVRNAVHDLDPDQPIYRVQTIDEVLSNSIARQRVTSILLGMFALMALALSAIGVYGVLSYSVTQRTREIGIRMAIGAQRRDVVTLVIWQAARFSAMGIAAGLALALVCAHLLDAMLFKTSVVDPLSIAITITVLAIVAALAVSLPASRAASVNPIEALRAE
jgi:predicted permease